MTVVSVGVDHERVPLGLLERLAVPAEEWGKVTRALVQYPNLTEAILVSTCLRTEVYANAERFHGAVEEITTELVAATGVPAVEFADHLTVHFDRGVTTHLFSVAAGLCSAVPGEYEVLGQVRRALEAAESEQTVGDELRPLFAAAVGAGRRARSETTVARGTSSFAAAAVDLAAATVGPAMAGATVVVIGAGQLASGVVRALCARPEVARVTIVNRSPERAQSLADQVGDARVVAASLDSVAVVARGATLIVAAAASPTPLLAPPDLAPGGDPVLIVDLGVPRVVDPAVAGVPGVQRLDLTDLRAVVGAAADERREAIDAATSIVAVEVERFHEDRRSRGAAEIVTELRDRLEGIRLVEFDRRRGEFSHLSDDQRELVESLTRSVVAKIAHGPTVALKEAAGTDRGQRLTEAVRALFDL